MFELRVDPNAPHHYLIGVAVYAATAGSKAGKLYLKYGPIYFTNKDVEQVRDSCHLTKDKIYKSIYEMTNSEIYHMMGCNDLIMSIFGLKMACEANQATIHHFSCEIKLDNADNFFEGLVERANKNEREKQQLNDSNLRQPPGHRYIRWKE